VNNTDLKKVLSALSDYSTDDLYELESKIGSHLGRKSPRKKPEIVDEGEILRQKKDKKIQNLVKIYPVGSLWFIFAENQRNECMITEKEPDFTVEETGFTMESMIECVDSNFKRTFDLGYSYAQICEHTTHVPNCDCAAPKTAVLRGTIVGHDISSRYGDEIKIVRIMTPGRSRPVWVDVDHLLSPEDFSKMVGEAAERIDHLTMVLDPFKRKLLEIKKRIESGLEEK